MPWFVEELQKQKEIVVAPDVIYAAIEKTIRTYSRLRED